MAVIMPELQIGLNDYLALDQEPAFVYHFGAQQQDITAYAVGGHIGARIAPAGTGLTGFYGVPRVAIIHGRAEQDEAAVDPDLPSHLPSGDSDSTVVAPTLELGHAWAFGHFLGAGAGYGFAVAGDDIYASNPVGDMSIATTTRDCSSPRKKLAGAA